MTTVKLHDGRVILVHGDCLNILPKVKPKIVSMIFADLPYGTTSCKWDQIIPFDQLWPRLKNVCKPFAAKVFTAREPFTSILVTSNIKEYHHKWVWNKKQSGSFQTAQYMPLQIEEDVVVFGDFDETNEDVIVFGQTPFYYPQMRKGKMRKRGGAYVASRVTSGLTDGYEVWSDDYFPVNILDIVNPRIGKLHPTEKPLPLLEYLIKTYTNEDDIVLDPTFGSNTTCEACIKLNRRYIGIERDNEYFDIGVTRAKKAVNLYATVNNTANNQ